MDGKGIRELGIEELEIRQLRITELGKREQGNRIRMGTIGWEQQGGIHGGIPRDPRRPRLLELVILLSPSG